MLEHNPHYFEFEFLALDMIIEARTTFGSPLFREIFITACWVIWSTRNGVIFDSGQINLNVWKNQFREVGL
jgi:hypothetical protein